MVAPFRPGLLEAGSTGDNDIDLIPQAGHGHKPAPQSIIMDYIGLGRFRPGEICRTLGGWQERNGLCGLLPVGSRREKPDWSAGVDRISPFSGPTPPGSIPEECDAYSIFNRPSGPSVQPRLLAA